MNGKTPINTRKTAFEIRLDLLNLAQRIASEQHIVKSSLDKDNTENRMVSAPDENEIIRIAERLNEFVSRRDDKK